MDNFNKKNSQDQESYYRSDYDSFDSSPPEEKSLWYYVSIIGKKIWYLPLFLLIGLIGSVFYSFNQPEMFQATSSVRLLRDAPNFLKTSNVVNEGISGKIDFNTKIASMRSSRLINNVKKRLSKDQIKRLIKPYSDNVKSNSLLLSESILSRNLSVETSKSTYIVSYLFEHQNKLLAKEIANLFATEFIQLDRKRLIESSSDAANSLTLESNKVRKKYDALLIEIADYRKKNNLISLQADESIDQQELAILRSSRTSKEALLIDMEITFNLIQECEKDIKKLLKLQSIASDSRVAQISNNLTASRIEIKTLSSRYKEKHPMIIQAKQRERKLEEELQNAVESAVIIIETDYASNLESFKISKEKVEAKEKEMFERTTTNVEYALLLKQRDNFSKHLDFIETRKNEEMTKVQLKTPSILINELATVPNSRSSPNHFMNIATGSFVGLFMGVFIIVATVCLDNTVKTHLDVENEIGLEISGIIPLVKELNNNQIALLVSNNLDPRVVESFNSVYSTLKIRESLEGFNKCLLVTSTIPGEGKSFVCTNLGLTFAMHGQKTLLIDADLRLPNIAKSLNLKPEKGLINFFTEEISLDKIVTHDVYPNMDLITSGGKSKNSSQILCSKEFSELIMYFRQFYDRIIVDAPPMAAVSDPLNILPLVDGFFYVVRSNVVNKKVASLQVSKAKSSKTPALGAILNQVSSSGSYYYYSQDQYGDYLVSENQEKSAVT